MKHTVPAIFALAIAGGAGSPVVAQTWDGGGAISNWSTANNWNPNGVPTAGAIVNITGAGGANQPVVNSATNSLSQTNVSGGSLDIDATLTSANVFVSGTGVVRVRAVGAVVGNLSNSATFRIDGTLNGNFASTGGTTAMAGLMTGGFNHSGGTTTLSDGARITNLVQLSGGTLQGAGVLQGGVMQTGGLLQASGGTMAITGAINAGAGGTVSTAAGGLLQATGAAHTIGTLAMAGSFNNGANSVTITGDYSNANFGSGSGFNARAGITGTGAILAASAIPPGAVIQRLSAIGLTGGTSTSAAIDLGTIRVGDTVSRAITIHNDGGQTLRGAVFGTSQGDFTQTGGSSFAIVGGGTSQFALGYTAATTGSIAPVAFRVVNNFDNVADQTLSISGFVNNRANPVIVGGGGALPIDPITGAQFIDLGVITVGSVFQLGNLSLLNSVGGPADTLSGGFLSSSSGIFRLDGVASVNGLGAGIGGGNFSLLLDTARAGLFEGQFIFAGKGRNSSDPVGEDVRRIFHVRASLIVPEPANWAMLITGFGVVGAIQRRRRRLSVQPA